MNQQKTRIYRRFTVELDYPQKLNVLIEDAGVVRLTAASANAAGIYLHASDFVRIADMIKDAEVR